MDLTTAFWYAVGVIALLVFVQVFAKPLEMLFRALGNSIVGGVALWGVNLVGGLFHYHLGLNPVSAAIVGLLGVPGLVGLGLVRVILG